LPKKIEMLGMYYMLSHLGQGKSRLTFNYHCRKGAAMILLFSVDKNWNIGYKGDLLVKISKDLKRFRRLTINNIIIMGRKTFDSLPGGKALGDRINIVVTRNKAYKPQGAIVVHSIEELLLKLKEINPKGEMQNYLIGGGDLANQLLGHCHKAYITKIFKSFEKADTSLHNLDKDDKWGVMRSSAIYYQDDIAYQYVDYLRQNT
jgi:dihydrofolate reductase